MWTPITYLYVIWKLSYGTLPCSGGHFEFCPLAANAPREIQGTCCSGGVQDVIPQISSLPIFSIKIKKITGLFSDQNFGATISCVTIIVVNVFKCRCLIMVFPDPENVIVVTEIMFLSSL